MQRTISRNHFMSVFGATLFGLIFASASFAHGDGPPIHDFSGTWTINQDNKFTVNVDLRQNGREITGTASYQAPGAKALCEAPSRVRRGCKKTPQAHR